MIRSVTRLPLRRAVGTPVFNIRLDPALLADGSGRKEARALIETYFQLGGMQMQVTVVDQEALLDAVEHPERHADLAVRVGGFSARFIDLEPALQQAILARTVHG